MISATDWPEPMKVLDQPSVRAHSSVMIDTDWRADMTMASVAKHSQTMIQGLMRDCAFMAPLHHMQGVPASGLAFWLVFTI